MIHMRSKKGFTMIELIIAIAIIAIMTMVMFIAIYGDRENRELTAAGRGVTAALREVQNNALTGYARESERSCQFVLEFEGKNYAVKRWVINDDDKCEERDTLHSYILEYDVKRIDDSNDLSQITFTVPHGTIIASTNDGNQFDLDTIGQIQLKKTGDSEKIFYICIHPNGQIAENGINNPCN